MSTYSEQLKEAQKNSNVKKLTAVYQKWVKSGEKILGSFIDRSEVGKAEESNRYYQYLFETDEGLTKFSLGNASDGEIGAALIKGRVYLIMFKGKEDIGGGRKVNRFECTEIGFEGEQIGGEVKAVKNG